MEFHDFSSNFPWKPFQSIYFFQFSQEDDLFSSQNGISFTVTYKKHKTHYPTTSAQDNSTSIHVEFRKNNDMFGVVPNRVPLESSS